jgi:vacuolar-type H+-ATPase catalytic subunit A/Vma1
LKAVREKKQITYKRKPIKITADFSTETLKARRAWGEVFHALNENKFNPRILYPAKLSFKIDGAIKVFHDKEKLKQYMTTKQPLKSILQGILHTESEIQHNNERAGSTKLQEKKSKKVESNLSLGTHNQIFKQLRQLNDRNHHIPISTNTKC